MQKRTALSLIFIGSLGLYIFAVGLVLPDFFQLQLTGDNVRQDWDSLGAWHTAYGGQSYLESGNLVFKPGLDEPGMCLAYVYASATSPGYWRETRSFTVEFKAKVPTWASGTLSISIYSFSPAPPIYAIIGWDQDSVNNYLQSGQELSQPYSINNEWHVYTTTFDFTKPEIIAYLDGVQVAQWTPYGGMPLSGTTRIVYGFLCTQIGGEAYCDYLYIDNGIKPPSGPSPTPSPSPSPSPGAETGILRIFASYNGAYVVASVTVSGTESKPSAMTTTDANNPLSYTLKTGSYTVSVTYSTTTYSTTTQTDQFQLTTSGHDANINFGGVNPPPKDDNRTIIEKIIDKLNEFLANRNVKGLGCIGSVLCLGVGVLGLIPSRPHHAPPPRPYYGPPY